MTASFCPISRLPSSRLEVQQLLLLALAQLVDRDAGPGRDDRRDVLVGHLVVDHARAELLDRLGGRQLLLDVGDDLVVELRRLLVLLLAHRLVEVDTGVVELALQVADRVQRVLLGQPPRLQLVELRLLAGEVGAQLLEAILRGGVLLLLECELLDLEPVDGALQLVDLDRARVDLHLEPAGRLVDQVDRLVGQLTGCDVAVAEGCGGHQRAVGDRHLVVGLVALLEPAEDRDGVLHRRLADVDLLEPALERGVLLDVLAVLVERRGTDHAQLAARQHRLQHVGRRDRSLAAAGAHERVQLVDERDDLAVGVVDLLEHGLQALLELAAVLGAGDQSGEVERHELLVLERVGDVAGDDALGEALDDRGLADAGLADEHRVVLGAAGQHLADAADLGVTADDRVELAALRDLGEVDAVLLEGSLLLLLLSRRGRALHVGHAVSSFRPAGPRYSSVPQPERTPDHDLIGLLRALPGAQRHDIAL